MGERTIFKTILWTIGIVLFLLIQPFWFRTVEPTQVGVLVDNWNHKVASEPLYVGFHGYNKYTQEIIPYRVAARAYPNDIEANERSSQYVLDLKTNDGQNINVDLTIIYSLAAKEVPALHQQVGPNYQSQILLPEIKSEARIAIGQYSAEEIYQGKVRETIQQQIKQKLVDALSHYPAIQVQDALMRHFSFSREFEGLIEAKKQAAQKVEINKNNAAAQEQEALRVEAEARGNKLRVIQQAEGDAQAVKINADAKKYQLEQEAAGRLAQYKAEAEGKRLSAEALGGGANVVALEFAKNIPDKLQIWGIPTGANSTTLMDLNGLFKGMLPKAENK